MARARKKTVKVVSPEEMPSPWLVDSEFVLNELARLRELILRIPVHSNTVLPVNTAIDSVWRLEQQLRYILHIHREGQRSFARRHQPEAVLPARAPKATPAISQAV